MVSKIKFILNNELQEIEINPATVLLDFVRSRRLTGTKEGCKEGDCGACTVLVGELSDGEVHYNSINSCLVPVQNIDGKHIVTIEGLNPDNKNLNPVQEAFLIEGASQCGFCTPGFIVSLTGYFLNEGRLSYNDVIDSLDGNICRCTGHNSIIRAAKNISDKFKDALHLNGTRLKFLVENKIIPDYFLSISERLEKLSSVHDSQHTGLNTTDIETPKYFVGGGTDLFVQKPNEVYVSYSNFLEKDPGLKGISISNGYCILGTRTTVTELLESNIIRKIFPDILKFAELFGSTPIRNSATIGGNINNASPIGDMTAFFMALNSTIILSDGKNKREIPLNKYYKSYKVTERKPGEFMHSIMFKIPEGNYFFNFEKVSKRTYLDIASVNSAMLITLENDIIKEVNISAGGVAAVPMILSGTMEFLTGSELNVQNITEAVTISQKEISPISDARGSDEYKRLLLSRLIYTHFITLFPEIINIEETV